MKKMDSDSVLEKLCKHILASLEELTQSRPNSEFTEGQIISFVECLEIVSVWKRFPKFGITDIEERFPVE